MWEFKRKLLYALSVCIIIAAFVVYFMRGVLFPAPTCFDGKKNGFETDIDCGGECQMICKQDVSPLTVIWSKAVSTGYNMYDLVALITNANIDNASKEVGYAFSVYDKEGSLITMLNGSTTAPLDGKFPIIIQNVSLEQEPANTNVVLADTMHYKVNESPTSPTVRVLSSRYEVRDISRVYVTIANRKRIDIRNLPVRVLLYDEQDNMYAAGQTIIPELLREGVKEITITWNEKLPLAPTRIEVFPIFNPFEALPN